MTTSPAAASPRQAGAQWVRCALQVNPYAYHEVNSPASLPTGGEDVYIAGMVKALLAANVELVGITDHWRAERSETLREACTAAGITVLPGFEATASEGVHVLVLFDPGTDIAVLNQRIAECGVPYNEGQSEPCDLTTLQLLRRVRSWEAVAIPAHVTGRSGLLTTLSGLTRVKALTSPDLFAVAVAAGPDAGQRGMLEGSTPEYRRDQQLAVLQAADVNGPADLERPEATCWVRLSSMSAAGLGRAVRSPETRVRLDSPAEDWHPRLLELSVDGGFLDGLRLPLNDELNVLIGGRGAGKSTVLECIRFALDVRGLTKRGQDQHDAVIEHVLGTATKVTLTVECGHPTPGQFRIERTQGGPSRVLDATGLQQSSRPIDVFPGIEIYGQRELADVADDKTRQAALLRSLLDQYSAPSPTDLDRPLRLNRESLDRIDQEVAALDETLAGIPAVQERLERLGGAGVAARLTLQSDLDKQDRVLRTATERADEVRSGLTVLTEMADVDATFASPAALAELPDRAVLAALQPALDSLAVALEAARTLASSALTEYETAVATTEGQLSTATAERRAAVNAQLRTLSGEGINGREFLELERRVATSHGVRQSRERFVRERDELDARRRQLVASKEDATGQDARRLQGKAREVTGRLHGLLQIDVAARADVAAITTAVDQHTRGRMAEVKNAVESLSITGLQLADAGRKGQSALEALLGTRGAAVTTLANAGEPLWRALEEIPRVIHPTIELNVGTQENQEWREISHLSAGQKATAMLILLLHHGNGPLLIDQPEDDLDNAFVSAQIVPRLRSAKARRQFVLCTHNANIPVLGDADLVAALSVTRDAGRTHAVLPDNHLGSLDTARVQELVEDLLEGGKTAFETRRYRYGF
jgi:PHP family Zn ribbon phosphoesterase